MVEQHFEDKVMGSPVGCAESRVQRRFAGIRQRPVDVRALRDQELAQMRMPVKHGSVEVVVVSERLKRLTLAEQELDGADITVIGAPLDQGYPMIVLRGRRAAGSDEIEDQIRAPVHHPIE